MNPPVSEMEFWVHIIVLMTVLTLAFLGMFFVLRVLLYEIHRFARHETSTAVFSFHLLFCIPPLMGFLIFLFHTFKYMIESFSQAYYQWMNVVLENRKKEPHALAF